VALQVLGYLRDAPLSKSDISRKFGRTKPNRSLNELVRKLRQAGFVEYTIPAKPNSRLQKYRCTAKGEILLQNQDGFES
jgi:DNA-binding PadR family transcriptional regulator